MLKGRSSPGMDFATGAASNPQRPGCPGGLQAFSLGLFTERFLGIQEAKSGYVRVRHTRGLLFTLLTSSRFERPYLAALDKLLVGCCVLV